MPAKRSLNIFGRDERLTCEATRPHLSSLIDGELSEQDDAILRLHLSSCPSCAADERTLAAADRVLQGHEELAVPAHAWNEISKKLAAEGLIRRGGGASGFRPLLRPIPAAAILTLLAAAGLAAGLAIPSLAVLGAGFGWLTGFLLSRPPERVTIFGLFQASPVMAAVPLLIVDLAILIAGQPSPTAVVISAASAALTTAGVLYARRRAA